MPQRTDRRRATSPPGCHRNVSYPTCADEIFGTGKATEKVTQRWSQPAGQQDRV